MEHNVVTDTQRRVLLLGPPSAMRDAALKELEGEGWTVWASEEPDGAPEEYQALVMIADLRAGDQSAVLGPTVGALFERIDSAIEHARAGMSQSGGPIIVVGSPLGLETEYGLVLTSVVRRALAGLARGLCLELGDHGIRANVILPGVLKDTSADMPGVIPLIRGDDDDRRGTVQDIAQAIAYLISDDSSYISGAELVVDGGLSQCRSSAWTALWDAGVLDAYTDPSAMFL